MTHSPRWRVYLDSNFFIRFVESRDERLLHVFKQDEANHFSLHTSELTLAEVLVEPIRPGDIRLADEYTNLLAGHAPLEIVPIGRDILISSAQVRATIGNKLPDAIHVATAAARTCNVFLSSDKKLRLPDDIVQITLENIDDRDRWP